MHGRMGAVVVVVVAGVLSCLCDGGHDVEAAGGVGKVVRGRCFLLLDGGH